MGTSRAFAVAVAAVALFSVPGLAAPAEGVADTPPPPDAPPQLVYHDLTPQTHALEPSLSTAADIDRFLAPTPLRGQGAEFVRAEARTGVNSRFLVGITWIENNSGRAGLAQTQFNLFSFVGNGPYGFQAYSSFEESIQTSADYIGREYARPGGAHYRGGTIADIGHIYAEDPHWAERVSQAANYIGPSRGTPYAAAVSIRGVDAGGVGLRVVNQGYAAWEQAGARLLLVHYRWSKRGAASSGLLTLPAPALRFDGQADLTLPITAPDEGMQLQVLVELAGDGWVTALGPGAREATNGSTRGRLPAS
jgi:hypothetical protein